MKIVLASNNAGKVKEFRAWMPDCEIMAMSEMMDGFDIVEDGASFKENALIKARVVYERLADDSVIVMSDDSGISVDALGGEPGIFSARYSGEGATSEQNLAKLTAVLKEKGLSKTPAHYTAAIALVCKQGEFCVHGWMHGFAIDEHRGNNGFGYDPMFMPQDFTQTLGELDESVKKELSHRSKALHRARIILKSLEGTKK